MEPRDQQRRQFAALADEDHHILGSQRAALGGDPGRRVDPGLDLARQRVGEQAGSVVEPALLARRDLVRLDRRDRRPQHDAAATLFRGLVRRHVVGQAEGGGAEMRDQPIDHRQHGRRRAEGAIERESGDRLVMLARHARERQLGCAERLRIGALEAEDRLLEIADGEDRAQHASPRALAGEELARERGDDPPLRDIGILRLVDEDVVGALVELVAHPFAHARRLEQAHRQPDQIVEIDRPRRALRRDIAARIGLPCAQPGR